jgi:DamX protein
VNVGASNPEPVTTIDMLASRAFTRDVGPRGLYVSPTLQQRLDLIEHLIEFGRQIIVLSGSIDSGKSTLLNYFADTRRGGWYPIRVHGGPGLTADGLLDALATELEVVADSPGEQTLGDKVQSRIAALERTGKVVVLLVDDAEQLLPEASTLIVKLAHADDQFVELRVLLAADLDQSALLETLQRAHPQHGLVHVVEIPRLIETQVRALIEQRMLATELDVADYFSAQDYARISAAADGMVGKIVTLARQHLAGIAAPTRARPRRKGQGPSRTQFNVLFGVLAAAAVGFGAWWATRSPLIATAPQTETIEVTPSAANTSQEDAAEKVAAPPVTSDHGVPASDTESPAAQTIPLEIPVSPESSKTLESEASPPPQNGVANESAPQAPATAQVTPPAAEDKTAMTTPVAPVAEPAPITSPPAPPPEPPVKTAAIQPAPVASPPLPVVGNFSADWLLKQPAGAHTLQLFGVRERAAAERYRNQRGIGKQSVILTGALDGKPWYVVAYGVYPNRTAALAAMSRLPAALQDTKPWARSIGSLRDALK